MRRFAVFLATCVSGLAQSPLGQSEFDQRWQGLRSAQLAGVNLEISAEKPEYYLGEPVRVRLSLTAAEPNSYRAMMSSPDRAVFPGGTEEVLADPSARTEDPWKDALAGGSAVSVLGGVAELSQKPVTWEILLNDWVRFRGSGEYRIAVTTRRVHSIEPVSGILTLRIVAPPVEWAAGQIAAAELERDPKIAGAMLRSLDTEESLLALAKRLGDAQGPDAPAAEFAILGSSHRQMIQRVLEARLVAADEAVSQTLFDTVVRLADPRGQKREEYAARLERSLAAKTPEARAISIETLLNVTGQRTRASEAGLLVDDFARLPPARQRELLEYRWRLIRSPRLLGSLLSIWNSPGDAQLKDIAVRRIYELAPDDGRRIILGELRNPSGILTVGTLSLLPDASLPELNDVFAAQLTRGQYSEKLMVRYATGDLVKQAEAAYEKRNAELDRQKLPHCGGSLVYYFLKYDPEYGVSELQREIDGEGAPVCCDIGFQTRDLDRSAYSPALEKLAIEFLSSPKVPVKRGAAEWLGRYGSPAAEKPLWKTLGYFHDWWQGRETEINQENLQFERTLRIALAQADGWFLDTDGLKQMAELCSSDWCRQEVAQWIGEANDPVNIMPFDGAAGLAAQIGRYSATSAAIAGKLRQFPAGTAFHIAAPEGFDELRAAVRDAGFDLR